MRPIVGSVFVLLTVAACAGEVIGSTTSQGHTPTTIVVQTTTSVTQPAPTTTVDRANEGTFATIETPPADRNWLQVSMPGGPALAEEPELCLILSNGTVGQIRSVNYLLEWTDEDWHLYWRSPNATYDGPVSGTVDELTVSFEGEDDNLVVKGTVTCVEP